MADESSITPKDLESMLCDEMAEPMALPLSLLKKITNNFSDEQRIGSGAFAVVYKGKLENRSVAVKKLSNTYLYEKEFQREVECLTMAKHKNVVQFLGYCSDTQGTTARDDKGKFVMADVQQRLLCFEYLPKGCLHQYITDASSGLRWRDRYQIIIGICQGLHYLHQEHIVHLDLKPANILLDDNWVPKITDFGLSRCFHEIQSQVLTKIAAGTLGYLAPEFFNHTEVTYQHSYRLDIYSLGVVIIEILTGEKGYHDVDKVVESWSNMLDKLHIEVEQKQVRVCAEIGIECTQPNPTKRPDTQHIINRLKETESVDQYVEIGVLTSHQLVQKDLVFSVKNEQGYQLNQLMRDLNNLHGRLTIHGLENVTCMEEALEANLAAKEGLTGLYLYWAPYVRRCSPEVEADVLEGLCPPAGLKKLHILDYRGSRYPDWMVGKQNGGPKDLQEFYLHTFVKGPAPQIVEAFPHLRVLCLISAYSDALPSNIEHLTSLKTLAIGYNESIRSLPTLPRSLEEFELSHCDLEFMKSCQTVGHPNWQKIEHVPEKTFYGLSNLDRTQLKLGNFWRRLTM